QTSKGTADSEPAGKHAAEAMAERKTILITGAAGNLGSKLRQHWQSTHELRLLDIDPRGDPAIARADLSRWDRDWVERFRDVDTVVHLAADPMAHVHWTTLIGPNVDALISVFTPSVLYK